MSTIFISHSSKDNDLAKEVERRLAYHHHHSVFLDLDPEKGIVAGQSWERTLYRKLRACRAVIALCTDHDLGSHWCFAEIALARMEGKHIIALQADPLGEHTQIVDIAHDLRRVSHRRDARVLLVIDQFEELLGREQTANAASRFLELLRASIESDKSPLMVLSTMRSDFLGLFQRNAALQGVDFESLSLGPMRIEAMRRVIAMPAKLAAIELESGLADRLLEDTETADALPLLSFTLWVLCRDRRDDGKLEVSEYEKLGGLQGTITREADAVLASASREHKEDDLRKALLQMARLSEDGSYARLPVSWDNAEIRRVESILETVVEHRILVSRMEGDTRIVEVAHEALFRTWRPLKAWLDGMGGGDGEAAVHCEPRGRAESRCLQPERAVHSDRLGRRHSATVGRGCGQTAVHAETPG